MQTLSSILSWIILWFYSWYGWLLLVKRGINNVITYRITALYFLFLTILVWFFYHNHLNNFLRNLPFRIFPFYLLICFFAITIGIYYFSQKLFGKTFLAAHRKNNLFSAMMDFRFLFAKSFDILFQQLLFLCLVLSLKESFQNNFLTIISCGIIFGGVHLPLLKIKYNSITNYLVICSFIAGTIFSALMLFFPYGIIYSYILHWSFYVLVGVWVNLKMSKQNKQIVLYH